MIYAHYYRAAPCDVFRDTPRLQCQVTGTRPFEELHERVAGVAAAAGQPWIREPETGWRCSFCLMVRITSNWFMPAAGWV